MCTARCSFKIIVDFILYNRLGENPTKEEIRKLLNEYELDLEKQEESLERTKLVVARLNGALSGGSLYADWHKKFQDEVKEILKEKNSLENVEEQP